MLETQIITSQLEPNNGRFSLGTTMGISDSTSQSALFISYYNGYSSFKTGENLNGLLDSTKASRTLNKTSSSTKANVIKKHPVWSCNDWRCEGWWWGLSLSAGLEMSQPTAPHGGRTNAAKTQQETGQDSPPPARQTIRNHHVERPSTKTTPGQQLHTQLPKASTAKFISVILDALFDI